jgi:hypothetical protein
LAVRRARSGAAARGRRRCFQGVLILLQPVSGGVVKPTKW